MTHCKHVRPLLTAWLDQELSAEDKVDVERHVADCLPCTRLAEQYRALVISALHNQTEEIQAQVCAEDDALNLWNDVEKRIQAETYAEAATAEISGLRHELEQIQSIVRALQIEVAQLRRQVNSQNQKSMPLPGNLSGTLMPGTQSTPDKANLQFLL